MKSWTMGMVMVFVSLVCTCGFVQKAAAENGLKIATISIQDIIAKSAAGQEAKKVLGDKVAEYQAKFQDEQKELGEMQKEIDKKRSVWSEEVRLEKEREYKRRTQDLRQKTEDAQFDLQKIEKKMMAPILKELHDAIATIGKKYGYTLILENTRKGLESRSGLLYADESLDISDTVRKELEARFAAQQSKGK